MNHPNLSPPSYELDPPEPVKTCDGCDEEGGILYAHRKQHYCERCYEEVIATSKKEKRDGS